MAYFEDIFYLHPLYKGHTGSFFSLRGKSLFGHEKVSGKQIRLFLLGFMLIM